MTAIMLTVVTLLYLCIPHEQYFVFYPSIDTRFASGYSEVGFRQIQTGMSKAQVESLVGEPLFRVNTALGPKTHWGYPLPDATDEIWQYSDDGACSWGDYAWLGRYVYFSSDGIVTGKNELDHRN
jgi:hypothetical protein